MMNSYWWGSRGEGVKWMNWKRLVIWKEEGGMGFRDLHDFNLAMLGKKGWKFMSCPDDMVTKLFKTKYFHGKEFLDAELGINPSYVWRNIWNLKHLLNKGHRWCIGDGSKINFWKNSWLRDNDTRISVQAPREHLMQLTLEDVMIPEVKKWDSRFIHSLLPCDEAVKVCNTPLLEYVKKDKLIWNLTKHGGYSVKSAYHLYMNFVAGAADLKIDRDWNLIWHLKVPLKVKAFLWKACRNCLPTRMRLQSKGINCPAVSVFCERELENSWHVFLTCLYIYSLLATKSILASY